MLFQKTRSSRNLFYVSIVIIIILGIFFRFHNLGKKVYWHDEVHTSLRIAGYKMGEVLEQVFNGQIIAPDHLLKFQKINSEKNLQDTFNALLENPEHPPLYYLLARFWGQIFGSSPANIRSLSAVCSLLVFPCLYWLCWELFQSSSIGWIAISIVAISPFHILYAQEAREYSLWTVTILLSSASLVRCIRLKKNSTWIIYTLTLALNLYISLLSIFIVIANLIYVVVVEKFRLTKKLFYFLLSSIVAGLTFLPWLLIILQHSAKLESKTYWTTLEVTIDRLLFMWQLHLSSIFIDLPFNLNATIAPKLFIFLLPFIIYTIYFLVRRTKTITWLFIVTLISINIAGLMLPDLILGGQRSTMTRYFVPAYLGIEIVVAYFLVHSQSIEAKISPALASLIIVFGIISSDLSSNADTWWNKLASYDNPSIAKIINTVDRPLVISHHDNINFGNLISLSYLLKPEVNLLLVRDPNIPTIPHNFPDIFVFTSSDKFLTEIQTQNNSKLEKISGGGFPLWKFK